MSHFVKFWKKVLKSTIADILFAIPVAVVAWLLGLFFLKVVFPVGDFDSLSALRFVYLVIVGISMAIKVFGLVCVAILSVYYSLKWKVGFWEIAWAIVGYKLVSQVGHNHWTREEYIDFIKRYEITERLKKLVSLLDNAKTQL